MLEGAFCMGLKLSLGKDPGEDISRGFIFRNLMQAVAISDI